MSETQLYEENVIDIQGYRWFGFKRRVVNVNAPKSTGDVGVL